MLYPNIWGQGALFAYSGYEGECTVERSVCGTYAADRLGLLFDGGESELFFTLTNVSELSYEIAASDIIIAKVNDTLLSVVFADENTIVGEYDERYVKPVCLDLKGKYYFCARDGRFVFTAAEEKLGRKYDIEKIKGRYLEFFDKLTAPAGLGEAEERTLAKCFSVMKSQVYSREGVFAQRWTTPDRLPHKFLWLWDSVFHSMGNIFIDSTLSLDTLLSVMDTQQPDGFIPHLTAPDFHSQITQPPVLAWGFYEWYLKTGDKAPLEKNYEKLKRYLEWNRKNRGNNENHLYEWEVTDEPKCRCDECGMDNSPRFDNPVRMDCVDFSCFMANEMAYMSKIAKAIGKADDEKYFDGEFAKIRDAVNSRLYCEEDGLYYDREIESGELRKVKAVSSLLPLFAGLCDETAAQRLVGIYREYFKCGAGVSSVSLDDSLYGTDMWRGPVWINYNYFIAIGMKRYGMHREAAELVEKTIATIADYYNMCGTVYEFYDSERNILPGRLNRKGEPVEPYNMNIRYQSIRDYGWTAAICAKLMYDFR